MKRPWRSQLFLLMIAGMLLSAIILLITSLHTSLKTNNSPVEQRVVWSIIDIFRFGNTPPAREIAQRLREQKEANIYIQHLRLHLNLSTTPRFSPALKVNTPRELETEFRNRKI